MGEARRFVVEEAYADMGVFGVTGVGGLLICMNFFGRGTLWGCGSEEMDVVDDFLPPLGRTAIFASERVREMLRRRLRFGTEVLLAQGSESRNEGVDGVTGVKGGKGALAVRGDRAMREERKL